MEPLKARILRRILRDRHRLAMLRHPAGDSLSHPQFQAIHDFFMGNFRRAQNQLIALPHVDHAGIAFHNRSRKFYDVLQILMQGIIRRDTAADVM